MYDWKFFLLLFVASCVAEVIFSSISKTKGGPNLTIALMSTVIICLLSYIFFSFYQGELTDRYCWDWKLLFGQVVPFVLLVFAMIKNVVDNIYFSVHAVKGQKKWDDENPESYFMLLAIVIPLSILCIIINGFWVVWGLWSLIILCDYDLYKVKSDHDLYKVKKV